MTLRWTIADASQHQYSLFGRLPLELRIMIWRIALIQEQRIWRASTHDLFPPVVARVSRESREAVLSLRRNCDCPTKISFFCNKHSSWFDPSHAFLVVQDYRESDLSRLLAKIQRIVWDLTFSVDRFFVQEDRQSWWVKVCWDLRELGLRSRGLVPSHGLFGLPPPAWRNKQILVQRWKPTRISRRSARPDLIDQLFSGQTCKVLDLSNQPEVQKVA